MQRSPSIHGVNGPLRPSSPLAAVVCHLHPTPEREKHRPVGVEFDEDQRFRQWWVIAVTVASAVLMITVVLVAVFVTLKNKGNYLFPLLLGIGVCVAMAAVWTLIFMSKLQIMVREDVLYVKYFPFCCFVDKQIPLSEIKKAVAVTYDPAELGGYGMRYSFQKKMWAYTTQGDKAVLVQTDQERFMLGTQHPFQLVGAITRTPGSWTESFIAENAVIEKV